MQESEKIISGETDEEIWQQIATDMQDDQFEYRVIINQDRHHILLDIDIDPGGGFESGYETTAFITDLRNIHGFKFAIHETHFTDEIGKFFGMQDVVLGFPDFDEKLILKTNAEGRLRLLFADNSVRETILSLSDFTFAIVEHEDHENGKTSKLELRIEEGITDPQKLQEIYHAFREVLRTLEA